MVEKSPITPTLSSIWTEHSNYGDTLSNNGLDEVKLTTSISKEGRGDPLVTLKKTIYSWADNTTFHGITHIFNSRRSKLRRFIWFLLIISMWCGLIISAITQYNRYFDYKTITQDTIRSENHPSFPSVTICNQCIIHNGAGNTGNLEQYHLLQLLGRVKSRGDFKKLQADIGPTLKDNMTFNELYDSLAIPVDMFLYRCVWARQTLSCPEYWKTLVLDRFQCFTFNHNSTQEKLRAETIGRQKSGLKMTVFLNQDACLSKDTSSSGIVFAVHEVGVEPDMSVSITLTPGLYHSIGVTIHEKKLLPPPVKAFGTNECVDTERSGIQSLLKFSPHYSLAACEHECISVYVNDSCGCIKTSQPDQLTVCDVVLDRMCATPATRSFSDKHNDNVERCGCHERCQYTTYKTTVSSSLLQNQYLTTKPNLTTDEQIADKDFVRENFLAFEVYLDSKVIHVSEQILDFTLGDLGASIGGFFGLAIGASVLTFCEIIDVTVTLVSRLLSKFGRAR